VPTSRRDAKARDGCIALIAPLGFFSCYESPPVPPRLLFPRHGQIHPLLVCQNCGAAYNRWQGKCESCGEWNTLAEEDTTGATRAGVDPLKRRGRTFKLESLTGKTQDAPRLSSGMTSSIASPAAGLSAARCFWSAAIPASASRRC
jgi:hypothetical protein